MAETASLFDMSTLIDPYPAYKALRDADPVHFEPMINTYVVTRYDLVRQAIKDAETFSSKFDLFTDATREAAMAGASQEVRDQLKAIEDQLIFIPPTMLTLDVPEHTQYRSLVSKLFTGSQVKASEDAVRAVINDAISNLGGSGQSEFMTDFALPVPLRIIGDRLGIPEEDRALFDEGATAAASGLRLTALSPEELIHRAQLAVDLQQLLVRLIEARRVEPRDDMITILANSRLEEADRQLTHGEALSILNQFLVAGHETTSSAFGWGMLILCRNPELQEEIRGDVKLIKTFVEEVLRIESPVQGLPRVVTKDTRLGDVDLPAGSTIMLRYGAANRDERQFADPDDVDVRRQKAGMQLAFGSGTHHCIGAPLARQELNLGFAALLDHAEGFRLADGGVVPEAEPSFILRSLPRLEVQYTLRG